MIKLLFLLPLYDYPHVLFGMADMVGMTYDKHKFTLSMDVFAPETPIAAFFVSAGSVAFFVVAQIEKLVKAPWNNPLAIVSYFAATVAAFVNVLGVAIFLLRRLGIDTASDAEVCSTLYHEAGPLFLIFSRVSITAEKWTRVKAEGGRSYHFMALILALSTDFMLCAIFYSVELSLLAVLFIIFAADVYRFMY